MQSQITPENREREYFRLLVESVRDYAIFILDPGGRVMTWNEGARRIKGYDPEQILGKHFSIFYPPTEAAAGKCERELEVAEREGSFEDEGWRIRKDGSRFWASVVITALRVEGTLVGFAKVTRDLTARRLAEEADRRFRLLVDSVKDYGIFMLDLGGHVATWNAGAERLKGYTASEVIGQHFSVFYPRADVEAGKCERELAGAAHDGRFEDEGWRIRKDGSRFWANVVITALRGADGALVGYAKVTRDLTERKQMEERERALAAEAAALEERTRIHEFQERFIGVLGHDLRNPLAAIEMGAGLLLQVAVDETTVSVAGRIRKSARRMSRMIEQILDLTLSRLGGGLELTRVSMDLCPTLGAIVDELRVAHPDRPVELRCAPPVVGVWDRDRLEQLFSNLVGNAVHHGAKDALVTVEVRVEGPWARVDVHNGGVPIPDALRETLFDPFRRGERDSRTKATEGLGLGLYISREIVLAHGGGIEVRSSASEGTTFSVRLPADVTPLP